jgi:hypothetical protein
VGGFVVQKNREVSITLAIVLPLLSREVAKDDPNTFHQHVI